MEQRKLILCKLKRGKDERYAWVPERLAHFGARVAIIDSDTKKIKDAGWWIVRVRKERVRIVEDEQEGDRRRKRTAA